MIVSASRKPFDKVLGTEVISTHIRAIMGALIIASIRQQGKSQEKCFGTRDGLSGQVKIA